MLVTHRDPGCKIHNPQEFQCSREVEKVKSINLRLSTVAIFAPVVYYLLSLRVSL